MVEAADGWRYTRHEKYLDQRVIKSENMRSTTQTMNKLRQFISQGSQTEIIGNLFIAKVTTSRFGVCESVYC